MRLFAEAGELSEIYATSVVGNPHRSTDIAESGAEIGSSLTISQTQKFIILIHYFRLLNLVAVIENLHIFLTNLAQNKILAVIKHLSV